MADPVYDLDYVKSTTVSILSSPDRASAQKICLQLPDYLLQHINDFYLLLLEKFPEKSFYFLADSTFGDTDADVLAAQHVDSDLLIFVTNRTVSASETKLSNIVFVYTTPLENSSSSSTSKIEEEAASQTSSRQMMKRYHFIEKLKVADIIGLLIGTFSIERYNLALQYATKLIRKNHKKPILCHMGQITPQKLANLPEVDIWVQICEPRNIIQDQHDYYAPICSFRELLVAFGELDFLTEDFDFNKLLPEDIDIVEKIREITLEDDNENGDETTLLPSLTPGKQLMTRPANQVATSNPVTNFLTTRTWTGLEVGPGRAEPAELQFGLDGYAAEYQHGEN